MWGEVESLCFGVWVNWAEVGFRYKSNGAFCTFFFFNFGLNQPYQPKPADSGSSRPDSAWIGPSQSLIGASRLKARGIHMAWCGRTRGQRRPRRVTPSRRVRRRCGTSSSGAASVLHRLKLNKRGREAKSTETSERQNVRRGRELMFWHLCELGWSRV